MQIMPKSVIDWMLFSPPSYGITSKPLGYQLQPSSYHWITTAGPHSKQNRLNLPETKNAINQFKLLTTASDWVPILRVNETPERLAHLRTQSLDPCSESSTRSQSDRCQQSCGQDGWWAGGHDEGGLISEGRGEDTGEGTSGLGG